MTPVEIICHDGTTYETEIENYNPKEINEQINNNEELTIVIGKIIVSRIDIKRVVPKQNNNSEINPV